jgi:HAD superfamily hydrolase (TIGR01509 family)
MTLHPRTLGSPEAIIDAVIFDMDGTLVDSEGLGERAIAELFEQHGIDGAGFDLGRFHGLSWTRVERQLQETFVQLAGEPLVAALQRRFHAAWVADPPPFVDGAKEAFGEAAARLPTAIASSSSRQSVEHFLDHHGLRESCRAIVCAEDCTRFKPDPQCFLLAARRLARPPERCLVFEDSVAGLRAALAAGMLPVAVTGCSSGEARRAARELASAAIEDFTELAPGFFLELAGPARGGR